MNEKLKVVIGSDHGGFSLKSKIIEWLNSQKINIEDIGTYSDKSCHYPVYAHAVAEKVVSKEMNLGILICTTGQGMAITANKYSDVRAALCWHPKIAQLSRAHNNSNILCLPGAFIKEGEAIDIVNYFLSTEFEGSRHSVRVNMISY